MSEQKLEAIRQLILNGEKAKARKYLRVLLDENPTADTWVLAASAMDTPEQAVKCLKQALELDAMHTEANRMILKLEGAPALSEVGVKKAVVHADEQRQEAEKVLKNLKRKPKLDPHQRHAKRQRIWSRVGCISVMLLNTVCGIFLMSIVGLIPGVIGTFNQVTGGPTPAAELNGTPIKDVPNAPLMLTPAISEPIQQEDIEVMDHGYLHEYNFEASAGDEMAIYVQFLSVDANKVSRNVVLLDPNEANRTSICERGRILQDGDNGVTMICPLDVSGEWSVRVLGRSGESVGVYFIGVERMGYVGQYDS